MENSCNLCLEVSGNSADFFDEAYKTLVASKKNILLETKNFILLPSVGPLNDTHLMIVPKRHIMNFASLTDSELAESKTIMEDLNDRFSRLYESSLIFFESGAGNLTNHSGGCIDHAHIHCLLESQDFEVKLFSEISLLEVESPGYLNADIDLGYIWYKNSAEEVYLCNNPLLPSQFLRFLYAGASSNETLWNWRKNSNSKSVIDVLEKYNPLYKRE